MRACCAARGAMIVLLRLLLPRLAQPAGGDTCQVPLAHGALVASDLARRAAPLRARARGRRVRHGALPRRNRAFFVGWGGGRRWCFRSCRLFLPSALISLVCVAAPRARRRATPPLGLSREEDQTVSLTRQVCNSLSHRRWYWTARLLPLAPSPSAPPGSWKVLGDFLPYRLLPPLLLAAIVPPSARLQCARGGRGPLGCCTFTLTLALTNLAMSAVAMVRRLCDRTSIARGADVFGSRPRVRNDSLEPPTDRRGRGTGTFASTARAQRDARPLRTPPLHPPVRSSARPRRATRSRTRRARS